MMYAPVDLRSPILATSDTHSLWLCSVLKAFFGRQPMFQSSPTSPNSVVTQSSPSQLHLLTFQGSPAANLMLLYIAWFTRVSENSWWKRPCFHTSSILHAHTASTTRTTHIAALSLRRYLCPCALWSQSPLSSLFPVCAPLTPWPQLLLNSGEPGKTLSYAALCQSSTLRKLFYCSHSQWLVFIFSLASTIILIAKVMLFIIIALKIHYLCIIIF